MIQKLVQFIFETFHLKQIKHEGVRMMGVRDPESIAEHSLNAAQIGYILAILEGADANQVAAILIWHDLAETRVGDIHKVGARYITNKKSIEKKVMHDQLQDVPCQEAIQDLFDTYEERTTLEGKIAKDADYLEQAFQAKIYLEQGHAAAQNWIDNVGKALQTESAQQVWSEMVETNSWDWRKMSGLKKL